jgi:hypothetical protein
LKRFRCKELEPDNFPWSRFVPGFSRAEFLSFCCVAGELLKLRWGWGKAMIFGALVATSLIVSASIDREVPLLLDPGTALPAEQKAAVVGPLVVSATECIARTVSADPRFRIVVGGAEFNNLIVESVPSCVDALRSMIDSYDRIYGDGAGETYFIGPYLDGLPDAVSTRIRKRR